MANDEVYACIIAAGTGSRMGETKQLLPLGNKPMLQHVIDKVLAKSFTKVFAIIGHEAERIQATIQVDDKRFRWIINDAYEKGQSTSLQLAFQHATPNPMMIFLGDVPFIRNETIQTVLNSGKTLIKEDRTPVIIRPIYENKIGHPVFIGYMSKEMVDQIDGDKGFKGIVPLFKRKEYIPLNDPAIFYDIDTKKQYNEAVTKMQKRNDKGT